MAMQLELTLEEARLLSSHLSYHLKRLDAELVRTDKAQLQHELAGEIRRLQQIGARLESLTREAALSSPDDRARGAASNPP